MVVWDDGSGGFLDCFKSGIIVTAVGPQRDEGVLDEDNMLTFLPDKWQEEIFMVKVRGKHYENIVTTQAISVLEAD